MRKEIALTALAMVPFSISHANDAELVGIVTADILNVRSGPSSNEEVLFDVKKDEQVKILETLNGWYKISNNINKEGWISSEYISIFDSEVRSNRSSNYEKKEVSVDNLNMRSGAGTSYRVITTLKKGSVVEVISESNGWSKIKYDGRIGYVYDEYLEDIKPSYSNTTTKVVNTDLLNVRSGPSTSYKILGKINKGIKVQVISEENGWSKILYNNKEAYVSSRYLDSSNSSNNGSNDNSVGTVKETKVVNTDSLNVRSGPSTSYSKLGTLAKGTKVGVISESNGWSKILYNNKEAYVSSQYLDEISSGSDDNSVGTVKETKVVNTDSLNVRSGPSTSYSKLGTLAKGTKVGVISESNGWSKILYNNKEAYVSSQYLDEISSGSDDNSVGTVKETKVVNTDSLNVRSGPSTSYSKLGTLAKGTKVGVISESNGWSKILYNNKEAYVSSQYLDEISSGSDDNSVGTVKETKVVNTDSLNVRSGPSTSYSKLGTLAKGTKVGVISESNGWSKILYNNKEAYVSSQYLDEISSGSDDNSVGTVKETKVVNTDSLNVRSGPSTSYSKLGTLAKGTKVGVISESNGWSKILYNNKEAYVSSQYLDDISSDSAGGSGNDNDSSSDIVVSGPGTINNIYLNYTLEQHLSKQVDRVSVGGNVSGGKPATKSEIEIKLNPNKILSASSYGKLQFLRIDRYTSGITASELNNFLNKKVSSSNVFYNKGQQFIDAAKKYDIDVIYLVAHSMWETGYGSSKLAKGQILTSYKGEPLSEPVKVYNFFGIGAVDGSANLSGAEAAYKYGWTSVDATIDGSAKWIAANYIKNSKYNQNTVYKMKWNYNYTYHQYATDINWCNGVAGIMGNLVGYYDNQSSLVYDILRYK